MGKTKKIKRITSGLLASAMLFTSYGVLADFDDVQTSDWFYNSVTNAEKVGIISGKGNNKFYPRANLTVAEAITLTARTRAYYNGELDELDKKRQLGSWVQKYEDYIKSQGISSVDFSELYDTTITRGMMADLFAYALPDEEYESKRDFSTAPEQTDNENVKKLYESGIMSGDQDGFRLNNDITRAEASAIIDRLINPQDRDFHVDEKTDTTAAENTAKDDAAAEETEPKTETEAICETEHNWVPQITTIHHDAEGEYQQVKIGTTRYIIDAVSHGPFYTNEEWHEHQKTGCHAGYGIYNGPVYETQWVVTSPAWDEYVNTCCICSNCGAVEFHTE